MSDFVSPHMDELLARELGELRGVIRDLNLMLGAPLSARRWDIAAVGLSDVAAAIGRLRVRLYEIRPTSEAPDSPHTEARP